MIKFADAKCFRNMGDKKELRKAVRAKVKALTENEKKSYSEETCRKVLSSELWKEASRIMVFVSLPDEIDTSLLLADTSKSLYIPKVNGDDIDIYEYSASTVAPGAFGIMEPTDKAILLEDPTVLDLVIVPGVAFTEAGLRLGRGKGFYDRFLSKVHCPVWGICFPQQIVETIPIDPWDLPLDGIFHV
jgi:5-formyltetrahydrofolate cyclo-ligase